MTLTPSDLETFVLYLPWLVLVFTLLALMLFHWVIDPLVNFLVHGLAFLTRGAAVTRSDSEAASGTAARSAPDGNHGDNNLSNGNRP